MGLYIAQLLKALGTTSVIAIIFSYAAIYFPPYITYSIIEGLFLSYVAYMVWEVKYSLSW